MTYPEKHWCMSSIHIHYSWNTLSIEVNILKIKQSAIINKDSLQDVIKVQWPIPLLLK